MRPTLWALLVVAPAVVAYLFPGVGAAMAYDRPAILAGEPWRLITGHWVHFSASHLVYDGLVVAVTGWLIESRGYRCLALLCLLSALAISAVMWIGLPEMAIYGGLSGVAMATTVYLAVRSWLDAGPGRGLWLAVLALCVGKLVMDASTDHFALVRVEASQVVAVPLSHLTGAGAGMLLILWHTLSGRLAMHRRGVLNGS
jgi:rhomboid family GlyGly-CTERM serine protease